MKKAEKPTLRLTKIEAEDLRHLLEYAVCESGVWGAAVARVLDKVDAYLAALEPKPEPQEQR